MMEQITINDIDIHVQASDWEDAITKSAQYLMDQGKITKGYVEAMIEAVHRVGPYIVLGNHVALAHARPECGVMEEGVHFTTLEPFINFGSEQFEPVGLIITLAALDSESHMDFLGELAEILMEEENVNRLISSKTKEEFLKNMNQISIDE